MTHAFDAAIALAPGEGGDFLGRTSPDYANFIGPYGGITAAQVLNAVLVHPQLLGEPVALTVNYAAALADGEFTARARPARTNRSTQHWIVELLQQGETVITATALTAARRETWGGHEALLPDVPRPAEVERERLPPRLAWLQHYERRFVTGAMPREWDGQGGPTSVSQVWMRDNPPRPLDFPSLTSMADAFFPRIFLRRATRPPLGTVTMTVYYHADSSQLAATGTGYLLGQVQGQGFRNGYFDHAGQLWNEAGDLLATTHQVMYFKE